MAQAAQAEVRVLLLRILEDLTEDDFKSFKWHLRNSANIPTSRLEQTDRRSTADLLVQFFPQRALEGTIQLLHEINRADLAQHLSQNNPGDSQR